MWLARSGRFGYLVHDKRLHLNEYCRKKKMHRVERRFWKQEECLKAIPFNIEQMNIAGRSAVLSKVEYLQMFCVNFIMTACFLDYCSNSGIVTTSCRTTIL